MFRYATLSAVAREMREIPRTGVMDPPDRPSPSERFIEAFGHPPDGVWSAPGRVNIIGEYTDLSEGFVLPIALPFTARAAVARRRDQVIRVVTAQPVSGGATQARAELGRLQPGSHGWAGYVLGVFWALSQLGAEMTGFDVLIDSLVPIGAGLSSSAALECAVALAVHDLCGLSLSLRDLARLAQRAENEFVGVPTGIMDQTASLLCRALHALFFDTRSLETRQVPFDLETAGLALLVINTGVKHALGNSAYAQRRRECERAAEELGVQALRDVDPGDIDAALALLPDETLRRRARHVISEQGRVTKVVELLDSSRVAAIGEILSAGHRSLRDDFEVSCPELDTVVDAALGAGAIGARMTGGGFGGSVLVVLEQESVGPVSRVVSKAFADRGYRPPHAMTVAASGGATRLL